MKYNHLNIFLYKRDQGRTQWKYAKQIESNVEEILVFNKIDKIDKASLNYLQDRYNSAIFVSALKQTNLNSLTAEITHKIFGNLIEVKLITSPKHLDTLHLSLIHISEPTRPY